MRAYFPANYQVKRRKILFLNVVDKHAPRRVMRVRNNPAPWLNSQLKDLEEMYEREWLKRRASETRQPDDWKGI